MATRRPPAIGMAVSIRPSPLASQTSIRLASGDRLGVDQIDLADEVGDEAARWMLVELGRRGDLLHRAPVHHRDAARHRQGFVLVVRHDDEGDADIFLKPGEFEPHLVPQFGVERRKRLIEQQHFRPLHQRAGERHALALAARHLVGLAVGECGQLHHVESLGRPGASSHRAARP